MKIHDTPSLCEIGDGVLASNVLLIDDFHTSHTIVQFHPDAPMKIIAPHPGDKATRPVTPPKPWVFVLRKMQVAPGEIVDAWCREQ